MQQLATVVQFKSVAKHLLGIAKTFRTLLGSKISSRIKNRTKNYTFSPFTVANTKEFHNIRV